MKSFSKFVSADQHSTLLPRFLQFSMQSKSMSRSTRTIGLLLLWLSSLACFSLAQIQAPCYVCRRQDRFVIDRDTAFDLTDLLGQTRTYTCGELEDIGINDLLVSNTVCGIFIAHADAECQCGGPPINPPHVIDTTPACDVCINGRAVPEIRVDQLVDTGIAGEMPCGFLYTSAADGFLPASLCPVLQQNVADFCCEAPPLPCNPGIDCPEDLNPPTPAPAPPCANVQTVCEIDDDCCGALICKLRFIGGEKQCSAPNVRSRTSVAGGNRGGSAGRAKFAN